jgi:hypothetical protein
MAKGKSPFLSKIREMAEERAEKKQSPAKEKAEERAERKSKPKK